METIKTSQKQKNILYVDSDKELVNNLQDHLEHHEIDAKFNLNFIFASSAKDALKKMAEMKIDLVVMEIVLPIVNGYYLINAIKKVNKELPIIIYTRLRGPQDLAKMAASDVDNIFLKQLMKMEDLVQIIVGHGNAKVELDKVLLELQSQVKSLSDTETQTHLKVITCPRCHMILTRDSKFCNNCGQKIFKVSKRIQAKKPVQEEANDTEETAEETANQVPAETDAKQAPPSEEKTAEQPVEAEAPKEAAESAKSK